MNTFDLSELVSDFLSSLRTWMSAGDLKERDVLYNIISNIHTRLIG